MLLIFGLWQATPALVWNNPHKTESRQATQYSAITGSPKTLDPARAYSADEIEIISQIYEPILQYHYLKEPYRLEPLTAVAFPVVTYVDENGQSVDENTQDRPVAYSIYAIEIKPGIYYQPHPAFAKSADGNYLYHHLTPRQIATVDSIDDFKATGTRELTADDYVYEIKRIASPEVQSSIFGIMNKYIVGLDELSKSLQAVLKAAQKDSFLDLRKYNLQGVKVIDRYHYQIKIRGKYPQFKYWLAMTFFCPIPWEAEAFYSQPGLKEHDITLEWYPVGTGPYMLVENNPNKQMVLLANPNFHHEYYPIEGAKGDEEKGYLVDAGKSLPFIEKVIFVLDKESIPRWNKFLQGYYDKSGVGEDSFDQAIKIDKNGQALLSEEMRQKGIKLQTTIEPGIFYLGFNMKDPVVGGYSEDRQKLRQAIAIALDYEEYIAIFMNGRGIPAQGPIPPGIFGYVKGEAGLNPYVYDWINGKPKRKSLAIAKKLLVEAGYQNGVDPKTGKALILNYDVPGTGNPDDKATYDWFRKQFAKIGIQLNIRATLYNRFQDRVREGKVQMFSWGWMADYPDPENFLFLLYGPNGKVEHDGENATNYNNSVADKLYEEIRLMPDGPKRQEKMNEFLATVRKDSPWVWGFHPITFTLSHRWNRSGKINAMARNTLKYGRINVALREKMRKQWNRPILLPLLFLISFVLMICGVLIIAYYRREHQPAVKKVKL